MELPVDPVTPSLSGGPAAVRGPSPAAAPADVHAALDAFFRGFGHAERTELDRIAGWVLSRPDGTPGEPAAALQRAQSLVEAWFSRVLGQAAGEGPLLARSRVAFLLCDGARRWPHALGAHEVPEEVRGALAAALPHPLPPQAPCAMPEQQLVLWPWLETLRRWWRASQADVQVP
jgi:hypothetical protein